jgi:hypothetical protein
MARKTRLPISLVVSAAAAMALSFAVAVLPAGAARSATTIAGPSGVKVSAHRVGTSTALRSQPTVPEIKATPEGDASEVGKSVANRSLKSRAKALRGTPPPSGITPTQTLGVTTAPAGFQGLDHYDSRTADGGNQYTLTPPDQGLCVGNNQVVEAVNNAIRVFDTSGAPLDDTASVNQFFWGDHFINRSTGVNSPHNMGDLSCWYDAGSNRFYIAAFDILVDAAGTYLGPTTVDFAVSEPGTALGSWTIYQVDTTNDGTDGTPSHPICPCFPDYPHIGTDANGFYISTNEYSMVPFGAYYDGANVYVFDKDTVGAGPNLAPGVMFNTARTDLYKGTLYDGFTLAPALSSGTNYAPNTMYFLSSDAFSGSVPIDSEQILVWKIANTALIHSNPAALQLTHTTVPVATYFPPPRSDQKPGPVPLAACLNLTACAKIVLGTPDKYKEYEFPVDSSDSRMLQSAYAHGKLWGALGTAVDVGGATKAGVAYFVVNPVSNSLVKQGTLAVAGNNISMPALGVTSSGHAVMAMSLIGQDYYPSAAYVRLNDQPGVPTSGVTVAGPGVGPDDDFSGYRGFQYNVPRWGDYGAASVVGNTVWLASEYIAQRCTLAQYEAAPFGTCNGTRTALANWATHITAVSTTG